MDTTILLIILCVLLAIAVLYLLFKKSDSDTEIENNLVSVPTEEAILTLTQERVENSNVNTKNKTLYDNLKIETYK